MGNKMTVDPQNVIHKLAAQVADQSVKIAILESALEQKNMTESQVDPTEENIEEVFVEQSIG